MFYGGSQLLTPLASLIGLPIDQFLSIPIGLLYRKLLKPSPGNTLQRHVTAFMLGMFMSYFCYGINCINLIIQSYVTYLLILYCPRQYVHIVVFVFAMGYLTVMQIYRILYDYGNYTIEATSAVMVTTQKLTSLAFSWRDGMTPPEKLTKEQSFYSIKKKPTFIEFTSYMFNFQGVLIGPLVMYNDYIDFITGDSYKKHQKITLKNGVENSHESSNGGQTNGFVNENDKSKNQSIYVNQPDNTIVILKKFLQLLVLVYVFLNFTLIYPADLNLRPDVLEKPVIFRFILNYIITISERAKYYLAWVLTDIVHNASGLGFNGYDEHGKAKWDLCTSVNILKLETSTSLKSFFDNWNIPTQLWFRRMAYDRMPMGKTFAVFCLSAFWHGFYPGYYLTFILAALLIYAGRGIRQNVRPLFQKNVYTRRFYSLLTWLGTMWIVNYGAASFIFFHLDKSLAFYNSWYWHVHVIGILAIVVLPYRRKTFNAGKSKSQ